MIKNLVFDFGGVIAAIDRDRAVQAFIRLGLKDADSRLDKYHQTGIFQELEEGDITPDQFQEALGRLCGRVPSFEETQQAWLGFITGVDVRILRYIEALHAHYKMYILSNTNPYIMDWACSKKFSTDGKPLTAYFDHLYCSYQMGHTKPDAHIFRQMLSDAAILPEETLFVDDGTNNTEAAKQMGMHTFQPANGEDWREALADTLNNLS